MIVSTHFRQRELMHMWQVTCRDSKGAMYTSIPLATESAVRRHVSRGNKKQRECVSVAEKWVTLTHTGTDPAVLPALPEPVPGRSAHYRVLYRRGLEYPWKQCIVRDPESVERCIGWARKYRKASEWTAVISEVERKNRVLDADEIRTLLRADSPTP